MKGEVLDIYGVKVSVRGHRVKYVLPWRRHVAMEGKPAAVAISAVLPCAGATLLPWLMWKLLIGPRAPVAEQVLFGAWATVWCGLTVFFTGLFTAMAWSTWTRWGRARIWVGRSWIVAVQLRGSESMISITPLGQVKGFSVLPDSDDPTNPATPGRLLADLDNNVKRILGDYPIELVQALSKELRGTAKRLRQ